MNAIIGYVVAFLSAPIVAGTVSLVVTMPFSRLLAEEGAKASWVRNTANGAGIFAALLVANLILSLLSLRFPWWLMAVIGLTFLVNEYNRRQKKPTAYVGLSVGFIAGVALLWSRIVPW